jgi:copper(I)-binding protein
MKFRSLFSLTAALLISSVAFAHDYQAGNVHIDHPYARATAPGQPSGAVYMTLENKGKEADKLVSVASPAAKTAEIHTMSMDGNVMRMREVGSIELKPAEKIVMQPGHGYHIMMIGLKAPLKVGDKLPMTLTFEKGGKVDVSFWVEDVNAKGSAASKAPAEHKHH